MRQEERYDGIRAREHDSDYSALHDFVGMRHVVCDSCRHGEEHVRTGRDTASILRQWQLCAANAACLRCNTDVTEQRGVGVCTGCFPARQTVGRCAGRQQAQIMRIGAIKPKKGGVASRSVVKKTIK